jgi:hypothetical protein
VCILRAIAAPRQVLAVPASRTPSSSFEGRPLRELARVRSPSVTSSSLALAAVAVHPRAARATHAAPLPGSRRAPPTRGGVLPFEHAARTPR